MHILAKTPRGVGCENLVKFFIDHIIEERYSQCCTSAHAGVSFRQTRHTTVCRQSVLMHATYSSTHNWKEVHLHTTHYMYSKWSKHQIAWRAIRHYSCSLQNYSLAHTHIKNKKRERLEGCVSECICSWKCPSKHTAHAKCRHIFQNSFRFLPLFGSGQDVSLGGMLRAWTQNLRETHDTASPIQTLTARMFLWLVVRVGSSWEEDVWIWSTQILE